MQSATRNSANILEHMESYGKTAYGDLLQSYDIDDIFSSNIFLILCHSKLLTVSMTKIYGPSYTLWFHQTWQWTIPWLVRWFFQVETSIYRGFNKSHITISDYRRVNHPTQGFLHHPSSPCWRNLTNMASVKKHILETPMNCIGMSSTFVCRVHVRLLTMDSCDHAMG